jgi:hypothetical protein
MTHHWSRTTGLCIVLFPVFVVAQAPASSKQATVTKKSSAGSVADAVMAEKRQVAISLLTSMAIEARSYRDEGLRARVQARVADALWDQDKENSRSLFRRAWEAAETFETQAPAPPSSGSSPGRISANRPPRQRTNLRTEILRLAARRDHALGEEFLAKLTATKKDEAGPANDSSNNSLSPAEIAERLRLAREFLDADNVERALQFADPALTQVSMSAVEFLIALRDKNPAYGDLRFANLLSLAAADLTADANTVSLLTSYAFTPSIYLTVSNTGIPSSMSYDPRPAPALAPALRSRFFKVASNILLRPFAQLDQSSAGRAGTYFIATRLYPLFQQQAPDLAPAISAQLAALGPQASQATVKSSEWLNQGVGEPAGDQIADELKDRLDRGQGADARDRAYAFAAMRAADAGDDRAQEFVDKIEDLNTRKGLRSFVNYNFITALLKKNKVDEAIQLARKSDLTHAQLAHLLTRAAAVVAKTERSRGMEILGEALAEARRIDAGRPERAYALIALVAQFSANDKVRAWELVDETIKAANAVPDFTGENPNMQLMLQGKFSIQMSVAMASAADLPDSFVALAEDDFYQAINIGKNFSGEAPRALATLAIARSILQEKQAKQMR